MPLIASALSTSNCNVSCKGGQREPERLGGRFLSFVSPDDWDEYPALGHCYRWLMYLCGCRVRWLLDRSNSIGGHRGGCRVTIHVITATVAWPVIGPTIAKLPWSKPTQVRAKHELLFVNVRWSSKVDHDFASEDSRLVKDEASRARVIIKCEDETAYGFVPIQHIHGLQRIAPITICC